MANKRKKTYQKSTGSNTKKPVNKTVKKKSSVKKPTIKKTTPKVVKHIPKIEEIEKKDLIELDSVLIENIEKIQKTSKNNKKKKFTVKEVKEEQLTIESIEGKPDKESVEVINEDADNTETDELLSVSMEKTEVESQKQSTEDINEEANNTETEELIPAPIEKAEVETVEEHIDDNKEAAIIDIQEQEIPKKKKRSLIARMFTPMVLIPILLVIIAGIIAYLYIEENPKVEAKIYKEFAIGDRVMLSNGSIWYVIENSDNKKSSVSILAEKTLDIDGDNKRNSKDYMQFDKKNNTTYNENDDNNIGHYLVNTYRFTLTNISGLKKVRLLTSTEYVQIREALELDYEWSEENWLAGKSIGYWWLNANQNGKIYVVNNRGSYSLQSANKKYYVRPVIEINKSEVKLTRDLEKDITEENKGD